MQLASQITFKYLQNVDPNVQIQLAGGSATPCLCSLDNRDGDIKVNKKPSDSANLRLA